ncbi:hypothetical protein ILYODFUR_020531 [Ilyodon furcidens]|uniref:Uncharacterized protein n=1 Tax=Ilyodon furcidens TaxID=33524 RepID=A0ABV0TKA4_9TELE
MVNILNEHQVLFCSCKPDVATLTTPEGLTADVREHGAHTSLSPLHRTTAVGSGIHQQRSRRQVHYTAHLSPLRAITEATSSLRRHT